MHKFIIAIGFFSLILLHACSKKDQFAYNLYKPTVTDIDSVYFSPGDVSLIADGQAKLKFIVETYRRIKRDNASDTMELFDYRLLPEGSLKVMEAVSGAQVGMTYSTNTIPQDTVRFYAQIGSKQSAVYSVFLRPKPVLPPKVYVDVIFHVWELNPANASYDRSSYQAVDYQKIVAGVNRMNLLLSNQLSTNANGASANVEFRLANKNASGQTLTLPGYDLITYSDEVKANPLATGFGPSDFVQYVNKNVNRYIWDPTKYLNVHVLPFGTQYGAGNLFPPKQLPPGPGQTLIPGITGIATGPSDYVKDFLNVTVFMPNTVFFPGYERNIEPFYYIGNFYGLYTTSSYVPSRTGSDWCLDTQEFNNNDATKNSFLSAFKVSLKGIKFSSEYTMDDTRYPSLRNAITLDQVTRLRAVMARCPGRMNSYQ